MKFRISSKDFIMFVVFVLLLLYLCGLAVTNITYFNSEGAFYGLNPLPAFTDYLGTTMLLFVIFYYKLIVIINCNLGINNN